MILAQAPMSLTSDVVLGFVLVDIVIILVMARLMGAVAAKVGQPRVVGEIIAGVLLGPTLLGPTLAGWDQPWSFLSCDAALAASQGTPSVTSCIFPPQARGVLGAIGQIALALFMFVVGLEFDASRLAGRVRGIITVAVGVIAVPVALAFVIAPALYNATFVQDFADAAARPGQFGFTLMVGAMLSVTAFPVMARILQEKGLTTSPMGSIGVAAAAVVTVLMFLLVAIARGVASEASPGVLSLRIGLALLFVALMVLVVRPALAGMGSRIEAAGGLTPGTFAAAMLVLFASAFLAHVLGINVIVGGFLAGVVLPARAITFPALRERLFDLTAIVLLPIFLAFSGLNTDFTQLSAAALPGIAIFLVAGIVGKWLGGAVAARLGGLSWAEGNVLGVLMNCRGLLILVAALVAVNAGVITPVLQVGAVLMALITTIMTGPLFDRFAPGATAAAAPEAAPARSRV